MQDGVSRFADLSDLVPGPVGILGELYGGHFRSRSNVEQRDHASGQLEVADQTRGGFHARLRAGFDRDRDEDVPERD